VRSRAKAILPVRATSLIPNFDSSFSTATILGGSPVI